MSKREHTQGSMSAGTWLCDRAIAKRWTRNTPMCATLDLLEQANAGIRAKVEHLFLVIKRQYGM